MKILPLGLGIAAAIGLVISIILHADKTRVSADLTGAHMRASSLRDELVAAGTREASLQQRLVSQDSTLAETRSRLSSSEARNAQVSREIIEMRLQLEAGQATIGRLERETGELHHELALTRLNTPTITLEEVEGYLTAISTLEARVAGLEEQIAASQPPVADPGRSFPVLSVSPGDAFVVLGYGTDDGARPAQQLRVTRGTETVATVQISEIRGSLAIAQVQPDSLRSSLRTGDSASIPSSP